MKSYLIIGFIFILLGCTRKEEKTEFPVHKNLKFTSLGIDEELLVHPQELLVYDSIAVIGDPHQGKFATVVDLNKGKVLSRCIHHGQGPDEFLNVRFSQIGDTMIEIFNKNKIVIMPVKSLIEGTPVFDKMYKKPQFKLKEHEFYRNPYYMNDSTFWSTGYFKESKFALFNFREDSLKGVEYIYDFPEDNRVEHKGENNFTKMDSFCGMIWWNDDMTKALYTSPHCYFLETYEIKNNMPVKIFEYIEELPIYRLTVGGGAVFSSKKSKKGLLGAAGKDNVYVSYGGRTIMEYPDAYNFSTTIHVYTWEGERVAEYNLDRDIYFFDVDEKRHRLYVVSVNPETQYYELGYYEI
ncbi:hypothetical protein EYV94_16425 [Puteibacter caeruleilacunae]|nr:hypothetical protein EYV94_16425 [Puteibacter caeruleilacunae]